MRPFVPPLRPFERHLLPFPRPFGPHLLPHRRPFEPHFLSHLRPFWRPLLTPLQPFRKVLLLRQKYKRFYIVNCKYTQNKSSVTRLFVKVEKILKVSLDLFLSPSPSVKIQIMGRKVCLRCKGKTLLGIVNKLLKTTSLLTSLGNVLPYYAKFPANNLNFH